MTKIDKLQMLKFENIFDKNMVIILTVIFQKYNSQKLMNRERENEYSVQTHEKIILFVYI